MELDHVSPEDMESEAAAAEAWGGSSCCMGSWLPMSATWGGPGGGVRSGSRGRGRVRGRVLG